jgi:hypothetical protein
MDTININNKISFLEKWAISKINRIQKFTTKYIYINKKNAIFLAFVVGLLTTIPIVFIENYLATIYTLSFEENSQEFIIKWLLIGINTITFSSIEIYLLYIITLKLFVNMHKDYSVNNNYFNKIAEYSFNSIMAKIALEIDEHQIEQLDADIHRYKNRYLKHFESFLYKAKIILTNAIAKILLRKFFVNNSMRYSVNYIAAPVVGIWDAVVMYLVIKKMDFIFKAILKINIFLEEKEEIYKKSSFLFQEILIRIISNAVSSSGEYHPNYKYILNKLFIEKIYFDIDLEKIDKLGCHFELKNKISKLNKDEEKEIYIFINLINKISRKKLKNLL